MSPQPAPRRPPQRLRRVRGSRLFKVAFALGIVVVLLAVADLGAREFLEDRISAAVSKRLGYDVDVTPGGPLPLIAVMTQHVDSVDVRSGNAKVGTFDNADLHIRLDGVTFDGDTTTIDSTQAEIEVPAGSIAQQVGAGQGQVQVAGVRTDPGTDTLTLLMGPGGVAEVSLRPRIDAGRLTFALAGVNIFGRPAPDRYRQAIQERLPDGSRQKAYPLDMSMKTARVTDGGVRVTLQGSGTELRRS